MGKIYFHADDYGRSKEVSKNILNCLINGNLNSVSIMINHDQKYHNKLKKLKNVNYFKFSFFENFFFFKTVFKKKLTLLLNESK